MSIAAEIIARRWGGGGRPLTDTGGRIHHDYRMRQTCGNVALTFGTVLTRSTITTLFERSDWSATTWLTQAPESPASRTTACSPATARSSTTSSVPACCTPASCAARSPARASTASTPSAALALPGVRAVFTAADLNPDVEEAWHAVAGKDIAGHPAPAAGRGRGEVRRRSGRARRRREPLPRRGRRRAGRRRLRAAARGRRLPQAVGGASRCRRARGLPRQRRGRHGRRAARRGDVLLGGPRRVGERLPADLRAGADRDARARRRVDGGHGGTHPVGVHADTRTNCARSAPACSAFPRSGVRVIMRDTGGGFGQKVVPMREDMCIMLAARKVPAALKWIEDRRENLMSAGQARHVDGNARMAFDDDGQHPGRRHRLHLGHRRVSDAVPGADHRRRRHVLPRPVPGAQGQLQLQDGVLEHRRAARRIAAPGSTRPWPARSCSTSPHARWTSTPSICAARTCCAATRCRTSIRTACRTTTWRRSKPSSRP